MNLTKKNIGQKSPVGLGQRGWGANQLTAVHAREPLGGAPLDVLLDGAGFHAVVGVGSWRAVVSVPANSGGDLKHQWGVHYPESYPCVAKSVPAWQSGSGGVGTSEMQKKIFSQRQPIEQRHTARHAQPLWTQDCYQKWTLGHHNRHNLRAMSLTLPYI